MEEQLEKELRFHIDRHAMIWSRAAMSPEEARREARLALGGPEQVKEECRDARGTRWLEDLWQDFRYALRALRQKPGFAAVALLTLALGSGATTVMFTVINGVLLKPFPYPEPERLVDVQEQTDWSTQWGNTGAFTYPNFVDCRRESRSLEMAAWRDNGGTLSEPGEAEYCGGSEVSSELFSVLGVPCCEGARFCLRRTRPVQRRWPSSVIACGRGDSAGSAAAIGSDSFWMASPIRWSASRPPEFQLGQRRRGCVYSARPEHFAAHAESGGASGISVWARLRPARVAGAGASRNWRCIGRHLAEAVSRIQ